MPATPEAAAPAGFWQRYAAWTLDAALLALPTLLVTWPRIAASVPDWERFGADLQEPDLSNLPDREKLAAALRKYVSHNAMEVDWDAVESAPIETLVHALSAGCPFAPMEKQALLEADSVGARCRALIALLDMDISGDDSSTLQ